MAEGAELIPVNVQIAGRSYRIRVAREDEGFVRASVKRANEQIAELRRTYAGKDDQDFIAMCLLMYAADKRNRNADDIMEEELAELSRKVGAALSAV